MKINSRRYSSPKEISNSFSFVYNNFLFNSIPFPFVHSHILDFSFHTHINVPALFDIARAIHFGTPQRPPRSFPLRSKAHRRSS